MKKWLESAAILESSFTQRIFLIALILLVFWNGLWGGVPRADQVAYLHQISQYSSLWDILANSPSWNRTQSAGDVMLFRPVLYLQLGLFYYLFKYNFFLWQAASLALHIFVVNGAYSLLSQGRLKRSWYPLLIAALFGCSFLASELVLWNHMSGYITFSLLSIYAVLLLSRFILAQREYYGYVALVLGVLAEFTYEFGVFSNVIYALVLFYNYRSKKYNLEHGRNCRKLAFLFIFGALLYPTLSIQGLTLHGVPFPNNDSPHFLHNLLLAAWYALKQLVFWFGGWILPAAYNIDAAGRASFTGFNFSGAEFFVNYALVIGAFYTWMLALKRKDFNVLFKNIEILWLVFCVFGFLFAYSFVIAYGRALPRGIGYVLNSNIYYSYVAFLALVVAISMFFVGTTKSMTQAPSDNSSKPHNYDESRIFSARSFFYATLFFLVFLNSIYTYKLASSYRFDFSPARLEVINLVIDWMNSVPKANSYFTVDKSCSGNDNLPWFNGHFRKHSNSGAAATLSDVLFPEKSFELNKTSLIGKDYDVTNIKCTKISATSVLGEYGPEGLFMQTSPGWHAEKNPKYPQVIEVDFQRSKSVGKVSFLPQEQNASRMPKSVRIKLSEDGKNWITSASPNDICETNDPDGWHGVKLSEKTKARFLKIEVLSNCGDPDFLTLRGLRVE